MLPNYPRTPGSYLQSGLRSGALALSVGLAGLIGCGAGDDFSSGGAIGGGVGSGGEFGATVGGVKDLGPARQLIKNGQVPPPESFLVEAMFSEHDLPLDAAPCTDSLCLRGAAGIAPGLDSEPAGWTQIGLSSNVDPATYQRPSLTAIFCVDVSGSMGWEHKGDASVYPTAGRLSYLLLKELAAKLGPTDRVALVTYGNVATQPLALTTGGDPALGRELDKLTTTGSTNMEAGLKLAYDVARRAGQQTSQVRIFLFTDENPNVGATGPTAFSPIVAAGASVGTSLTVFGMGLGVRQDLVNAMSSLRGANGYTLAEETDVPKLLKESWPWMASPLAYDLKVNITPARGFSLTNTYGFPVGDGKAAATLEASTVFLSQKKGALLLELAPVDNNPVTDLALAGTLSFKRPDGTAVSQPLAVSTAGVTLDARGRYFAQPSVGKSVALAVLVEAMKRAATTYATNQSRAVGQMSTALARITEDNKALGDPTIDTEIKLAADLLGLMQSGAPQGNLYGK